MNTLIGSFFLCSSTIETSSDSANGTFRFRQRNFHRKVIKLIDY